MRSKHCIVVALIASLAVAAEDGAPAVDSLEPERGVRREKVEKFVGLLKEKQFREAGDLFGPSLVSEFPYPELKRIWHEFDRRAGSFQGAISYAERDLHNGRMWEVRGQWDKAVMLIRLAFDDQDRIAGFWLARDREGPTPEHFRRGGYMFGSAVERISGLDHVLTVRVLDADGEPLESALLGLWKQVVGTPDSKQAIWDDPKTGLSWTRCHDLVSFTDQADKSRRGWKCLSAGVYLATAAFARGYDPRSETSPVVRLDKSTKTAQTTIQLPDGPSLVVRVVDAWSAHPVDRASVGVRRKGLRPPPAGSMPRLRAVDGVYRHDHLPPGTYGLRVKKSSYHPSMPEYIADEEEMEVEIVAGEDREITVKLRPVPLTEEEIDKRWPYIAQGTVTDIDGNPLAGVRIDALYGMGTLFSSGYASTDKEGNYRLRYVQGGGPLFPNDPPQLRLSTAGLRTRLDGYIEQNLNQHAGIILGNRMPTEEEWQDHKQYFAQFVRANVPVSVPGKSRRIDFVMLREVAISGRLVDESNEPICDQRLQVTDEETSSNNSLRSLTTDDEGRFSMNRIRPGRDLWFTLAESNKYSIRSLSLRFDRPGDYEVFLRLVHDKATGTPFFEFDAVSDGADCSGEVVRDSPLGRPPVKPALQAKGRELLGQIAEANRYWLGLPPEEVRDYRYTFTAPGSGQGRGTKKYEVRDDSGKSFPANEMEATHAKRHGITYYSALHFITAQPEDVVFRQVEIDGDEIRLAYSFKGRMWLAASRCLFASRNGFFVSSRDIHEGVVVLDRHTLAPREHTNSGFSETFSDYVQILPDHYAPREIRFSGSGYRLEYDYQFEFNVYHPGLWLFHTCRELDFDPRTKVVTTKVIASINGVEVNGKPAELIPARN